MTTPIYLIVLLATLLASGWATPTPYRKQSQTQQQFKPWWKDRSRDRNPFMRWEVKFWPGNDCSDHSDMTYRVGMGPQYDCASIPATHGTPSAFMVTAIVQNYTFNFFESDKCRDKPAATWTVRDGVKEKCYPAEKWTKYRSFTVTKSG